MRGWCWGALALLLLGCDGGEAPAAKTMGAAVTASARRAAAQTADQPVPPAEKEPEEARITISAVGDCAIGDLHHGAGAPGSFAAELAGVENPLDYPFSGVREIFAADDLTIANLEGTLTDHDGWQNPVFSIRGKPEYAQMLVRGSVELVDIDNNHSGDYGLVGFEDTKKSLAAAGVAHFGRGQVDRRTIKGIDVVNLGYLGGPAGTKAKMVADVKREKEKGGIVIVSFHWGIEGFYVVAPDQQKLGRAAIDAGADLVLGHHPHVLQGIETYRNRHIVYSLGNFVFGANSRPKDMDSLILQETFRVRDGALIGVEQQLIPVSISSREGRNDFRPHLLEGPERDRVLDKVRRMSPTLDQKS